MKISIDGKLYTIEPDVEANFLRDFQRMGLDMYRKQEDWLRFALKPVVRWLLDKMESGIAKIQGKEKAAQICRPAKREDPVVHWSNLMIAQFSGAIIYATLQIETSGDSATGFNIQFAAPEDQAGRSLDLDRDIGQREDDCAQVSGCDV